MVWVCLVCAGNESLLTGIGLVYCECSDFLCWSGIGMFPVAFARIVRIIT